MAREVKIAILGDARDFSRAVDSANRDAHRLEGAFGKVGGGIARIGKAAAIGAAGLAVGGAALAKGFVDAAIESQKVTKQTEAVLKSMGNGAGVTSKQIAKLSEKLSMQTGVDDELIQSGQNLLLTFGNLRNGAKKTEKNFDRATAAALDMSVALGTDMKSASMLVGKALNDPIKGLTALTRSGIQFTAQQKEQIKAMVAVGDVAGAQRIMLSELERQFGGSAAAQATAGEKLKVIWGNLQEQLGAKLLPVVEKAATWLGEHLPGAIDAATPVIEKVVASLKVVGAAVVEFAKEKLGQLRKWWDEHGPALTAAAIQFKDDIWKYVLQPLAGLAEFIVKTVVPKFLKLVTWFAENEPALNAIKVFFGSVLVVAFGKAAFAAGAAATAAIVAWLAVAAPVLIVAAAIAAVLGILYLVKRLFEEANIPWGKLWDGLVGYARLFRDALQGAYNWTVKILEKLTQIKALNPLDSIGKSKGGVSNVGDFFAGKLLGRAHGGSVIAGVPNIVGENGPELFLPGRSGTIIPNNRLGGGGGVTNIFNITTLDPAAAARAVKDALRMADARGVVA